VSERRKFGLGEYRKVFNWVEETMVVSMGAFSGWNRLVCVS